MTRIQKLQPLSAPSDVKRYFVSPEESGQICMLACMLGENREIFFPKLDEAQMITFDKIADELKFRLKVSKYKSQAICGVFLSSLEPFNKIKHKTSNGDNQYK